MRSRIEGALFGLALGDFLGRPVEQRSAEEVSRAYSQLASGRWPRGRLADNTALGLTLACAKGYAGEQFELHGAVGAMLAWVRGWRGPLGETTRAALELVETGTASAERAGAVLLERFPHGGAGTGSLMRAAATGLARRPGDPQLARDAAQLSRVTHADPRCVEGCVTFCEALSGLVETGEVETAGGPSLHAEAPDGFVLKSLERALAITRTTDSFEAGLLEVVSTAKDSDTDGAVAGALLGARFGIEGVPRRWAKAAGIAEALERAAAACARFRSRPRKRSAPKPPRTATVLSVAQAERQGARFFAEHGWLVVRDLFPKAVVRAARERFEPLFAGEYETGLMPDDVRWRSGFGAEHVTREIRNAWRADRAVARLALDERMGRLCARLMGWPGTRLNQAGVLWKPAGARGIGVHQDAGYLDWFLPHEVVTCWVALDDVAADAGPLEYVDQSHRRGLLERLEEFDAPEDPYAELERAQGLRRDALDVVRVLVPAGGAAFHHGLLLHGSGANTSDAPRRAVGIHCMSERAVFHPTRSARLYSRYHRLDGDAMDESFFPVLHGDRTEAADRFARSP